MRPSTEEPHGPWLEARIYALIGVTLVAMGVTLRSYVLNWVVGPMFVVVAVGVVTALADRRRAAP
jgi:hypothetical protein